MLRGELTKTEEGADNDGDLENSGILNFITNKKVKAALESFGDYKSPGPDEMPPIALKNMGRRHQTAVCQIYKMSITSGRVPEAWKQMKVTFIPKVGKDDYSVAKAYRPITLSNFLLKGLERIVQWYILEHVITRPLHMQHAYTKGRSCESALSVFVNEVEYAINNGKKLLAISLDCSGAFDCIKFESAEACMKQKGIPQIITKWYVNLLKNRLVTANVQGQKAWIKPNRGSPQGGVLSPLIWNLIMDSLLSSFSKGPVKALGYADDILLYIIGNTISTLEDLIQPELDRVLDWGQTNGLSFNPAKTSMVLFTRSRKIEKPKIKLGTVALELKDSFKYLGVEIHKSLSWTKHITDRANKCKFILGKCRNIVSRSWGLSPSKMDWIYKAIIRPKLTYGAVVWAHNITKTQEKILNRVQRLAMLPMTQPLRSTPTAGMEVILGWVPLHLHAKEVGWNTHTQTKNLITRRWDGKGNQAITRGHVEVWSRMGDMSTRVTYPQDPRISEYIWIEENAKNREEMLEYPFKIYTDASKTGTNVGYSWIATIGDYEIEEEINMAQDINVYKAEMLAIREALSWLKKNGLTDRRNMIFTDSRSAVEVLSNNLATTGLVKEVMILLKELNQRTSTSIHWVKGHSANTGNETADMQAKKGAEASRKLCDTKPHMPISYNELKRERHKYIIKEWQRKWENTPGCRISKLFYPQVREDKKLLTMNIKDLHTLVSMATGHGLYKHHLQHWNEIEDDQCSICGEDEENTWHLWEWCPGLEQQRTEIKELIKTGLTRERGIVKLAESKALTRMRLENEVIVTS